MPSVVPFFVRHRLRNLCHTAALLAALVGLLLVIGWSFAGEYGMFWSIAAGLVTLLFGTGLFPGLVLRMYGARELSPVEAPRLHAMIGDLARRAELDSPPRLCFIPSDAAIVFSTGHGLSAAVAISAGMLRLLTLRELFGVLAHEVSHIGNNDTWVMGLADSISRTARFISLAGQILIVLNLPLFLVSGHPLPWLPLLLMMVAPAVGALIQLALSRTREFEADLSAARLTGDPEGLASALARLEALSRRVSRWRLVAGHGTREPSLLRTHPDTEERVRRLAELAGEFRGIREASISGEGGSFPWGGLLQNYPPPRHRWTGLWY